MLIEDRAKIVVDGCKVFMRDTLIFEFETQQKANIFSEMLLNDIESSTELPATNLRLGAKVEKMVCHLYGDVEYWVMLFGHYFYSLSSKTDAEKIATNINSVFQIKNSFFTPNIKNGTSTNRPREYKTNIFAKIWRFFSR